jgi:signal transduction histidine kinase
MAATVLKISKSKPDSGKALAALQEAGFGVIEVQTWEDAAEALSDCESALVVCDGDLLEDADAALLAKTLGSISGRTKVRVSVPPELARSLSHELRTPLSAMAGWLHLMDSGTLDGAGLKRAIQKLRDNVDEQVRTIERHFGTLNNGRTSSS